MSEPTPTTTATATTDEIVDRLTTTYPGSVFVTTEEGLIVVRRPTPDEAIRLEDAVSTLTDLSKGLNPYAGLDDVKPLVVHPSQDRIEELLQSYPALFDQLVNLVRHAACRGAAPKLELSPLTDDELYVKEGPASENGTYPKRSGGRIFAVNHFMMESSATEGKPPVKKTIARYLFRRFGLIEHREFLKELEASGFVNGTGNRVPRNSTLAKIARGHVVTSPNTSVPDWNEHPYLLILLGQAVKDESRVKTGTSSGK